MTAFTGLKGTAAPLPLADVDTDKLFPARFLKTTERQGLGSALFASLRFDEKGDINPDFILNRPDYRNSRILVALENFGSGSSREHAVWALADFGINCVIAPSFAEIFQNNCIKNGIVPAVVNRSQVERLLALAQNPATAQFTINLEAQTIETIESRIPFEIQPGPKKRLLEGADEIILTMRHEQELETFEQKSERQPFLWPHVSIRD